MTLAVLKLGYMLEHPSSREIEEVKNLALLLSRSDNATSADNQQGRLSNAEALNKSSARFRTLRDYMPSASRRGEDIVRTAWRHAEAGRNDLPGSENIQSW